MFRNLLKFILIFSAMSSVICATHALTIATWNVEHLMDARQYEAWRSACERANWNDGASTPFRREPLPPCGALSGEAPWGDKQSKPLRTWSEYQAKIAVLKARAQALDADVVLLQEVGSSAAAAQLFDTARYTISSTEGSAKTPLHLAVAIKKGVTIADAPKPFMGIAIMVSSTYNGKTEQRQLRPGLQMTLLHKGQRIDVLNVHLKAGCRNDTIDQPDTRRKKGEQADRKLEDCAQLREQIPAMEAWIEQRQNANQPFIIAGDFNRSLWRERAENKPARCDATSAAAPLGKSCLANPLAEWDDDPAHKLFLAKTQVKAFSNGALCEVKQPRTDGESLCHCGIDHFLTSSDLVQKLGLKLDALVARGEHYGLQNYGLDKARPSDHCPLVLSF